MSSSQLSRRFQKRSHRPWLRYHARRLSRSLTKRSTPKAQNVCLNRIAILIPSTPTPPAAPQVRPARSTGRRKRKRPGIYIPPGRCSFIRPRRFWRVSVDAVVRLLPLQPHHAGERPGNLPVLELDALAGALANPCACRRLPPVDGPVSRWTGTLTRFRKGIDGENMSVSASL